MGITNYAVWIKQCTFCFMELMNQVFRPHLDKFVSEFIDDILISSKNRDEHEQYLSIALKLFVKSNYMSNIVHVNFGLRW